MIEIEAIQKNYDGTPALAGFSLRVEKGELFGLVGPNGAGKTTLMRILSTLVRCDGGEARIDGHDVIREARAVRALVGYMPDVAGLYQDLRVAEYLEFFAAAFHLRGQKMQAAVELALGRAGLAERRQAFVEELSLGWKQRLVLAKTLLHEPRVILLDEPATGLDPLARIELRERLKELNREGVTIFVSSHILADLENICTRVALIGAGRNAADEDGRTVLTLREAAAPVIQCEIELLSNPAAAIGIASGFVGARVVSAEGSRLIVEVGGTAQAAALLTHLTAAGVSVVRFDPRGPGLEERYRKSFGGGQP